MLREKGEGNLWFSTSIVKIFSLSRTLEPCGNCVRHFCCRFFEPLQKICHLFFIFCLYGRLLCPNSPSPQNHASVQTLKRRHKGSNWKKQAADWSMSCMSSMFADSHMCCLIHDSVMIRSCRISLRESCCTGALMKRHCLASSCLFKLKCEFRMWTVGMLVLQYVTIQCFGKEL